jgi:Zn-finger nucleic acid-binding protein
MNFNPLLLSLLSKHLGQYHLKSDNNYAFKCPNCKIHFPQHSQKYKLEIDLVSNTFNCWICGGEYGFRGKSLFSLFKKMDLDKSVLDELENYVTKNISQDTSKKSSIKLPEEYKFLGDYPNKKYQNYLLKERKLDKEDIFKYHIGYCETGLFRNRIIFPSYDKFGNINNFSSRSIIETNYPHMKLKDVDENVINYEIFINFNEPIIITESALDTITVGENSIPLFGKIVSNKLMERLVEKDVPSIYICLDKDAIKVSLKLSEHLMKFGKKVYLVELDGKDPNKLGKERMKTIIENTELLDLKEMLRIKLKI